MAKQITSVTVAPPIRERWQQIANSLGLTRSEALEVLIENAEIISRPEVSVKLQKNNRAGVRQDFPSTVVA